MGGFANQLGGGKVPIGTYTFKYVVSDRNNKFIVNSAEARGMEAQDMGDYVRVSGNARDHSSMIASFQSLSVDGYVTDRNVFEAREPIMVKVIDKKTGETRGLMSPEQFKSYYNIPLSSTRFLADILQDYESDEVRFEIVLESKQEARSKWPKSKLHVQFAQLYGKNVEIMQTLGDGDYYYADVNSMMDTNGNRMGARFLGTKASWQSMSRILEPAKEDVDSDLQRFLASDKKADDFLND